ncbi:class I SAM-dependent methyltransferase [Tautonia sp. JC769]|uniref:class I SAM-dependent methyltransferase n=1 Tax=Tautonia sp. JC769 TaxID=3232135 RepID=UPI00345846D8
MPESLKHFIKAAFARAIPPRLVRGLLLDPNFFEFWQARGLHALPVHFYKPVPDTRLLGDDLWTRRSDLVGVDMNEAGQLAFLDRFRTDYQSEFEQLEPGRGGAPDWGVLYCMIRHFKPRRVIEVGSGVSTTVSAMTLLRNQKETGIEARFTAIEPYPLPFLTDGMPGLSELRRSTLQEIPLSEFEALEANDILFLDSSHVLKVGSDVQYAFLEILPRLRPGVVVHVHDIFFPYEYPRKLAFEFQSFWNEMYLLQAFLAFNAAFEVLWSSSYLHHLHPDALRETFPRYSPAGGTPSSFWMRRIEAEGR